MADLMDQYATIELSNGSFQFQQHVDQEPISSGYVNVSSQEEKPMFQRELFNLRPASKIIDVAVCNNVMVVALEGNHVKRINIANPSELDTVDIPKRSEDQIDKVFLNPTGHHLLVSMKSGESFYLGRSNKKPRSLAKLKSHKIECIAWNKIQSTETTTGQILLGTAKGMICETEIDSEEKFLSMGAEKHMKVIFNVNENRTEEEAITGLHMEKFSGFEKRYVVMATTVSRLYQFVGDASNEAPIFQPVLTVFNPDLTPYLELPGMLDYSSLNLYYPRAKGMPKYFAWLTSPGVYFGHLDFTRSTVKQNITTETRLLPPTEIKAEAPIAIDITEFHCTLLYKNKFETICILNDEEDFVETIPSRFGMMCGLRSDIMKKTLWVFSESCIFQYKIFHESRNVWKLYLNSGDYDLAKDYCKHNPAQMDLVLRKQAESMFEEKKYEQAAAYYALTQISFEEVALKFIQAKHSEALKMFLLKKMVNLKAHDRTQLMMLLTWLIELYLNQLGELRDQDKKGSVYDSLQDEFRKFLNQSKVKACLEQNKRVAYDLLSSHADTENLIFFAMIMQDYPRVIRHHIQQNDFLAALEVLKKQREDYQQLFEQFSPTLMQHIPNQLVEVWKQRDLDAKSLIPALVTQTQNNDQKSLKYAVDYLEHCVFKLKNEEPAIHNYLVSLYCKMDEEGPLLRYLNIQGQDNEEVSYDLKYALRLCSENDKHQAAVQIYSTMGLYEEAVDLALKVDIEKAKLYADKPEYDDVLKKKLWLKVARHVVEKQQDIGRAMELLTDCPLLKIEDILPFFPDFVIIDHFKEAICESLQEYNRHIDELKMAMQDATESAKVVRAEIHDIRSRYGSIEAQEKCAVCYYPLVTRSFYYFPCTHVFHSDCLITKVKEQLKERQRVKLEDVLTRLSSNVPTNAQAREKLQDDLDELVAAECLYCGDAMIRSLDKPFIKDVDFEAILLSWK